MIEFKRNGPFERETNESDDMASIKIIGVGSAGVNVVDQIVLDQHGLANLLCIDTDRQALTASVVEEKILIGERTLMGLGTGGDPDLGRNVIAKGAEKNKIRMALEDARMAIVVTGLGGGTGGGMVEGVIDLLKEKGARTVVLGIAPLGCEGGRRAAQARAAAKMIRKKADAMLLFSNDRLLQIPDVKEDIRGGFRELNIILGRTCKAIVHLLGKRGLVQVNFSDFQELAGQCAGLSDELENCWVGMGMGFGPQRVKEAIEQTLCSPLFDDGAAWEAGDSALICVEGGDDFAVSEFHEVIEQLKAELPSSLKLTAGASVNEKLSGALALTLFVTRAGEAEVVTTEIPKVESLEEPEEFVLEEKEESVSASETSESVTQAYVWKTMEEKQEAGLVKRSRRQAKEQRYFAEQGELPLETPVFQGRFEKSLPTIFNGQNLDQPTFLRLGIKIRV